MHSEFPSFAVEPAASACCFNMMNTVSRNQHKQLRAVRLLKSAFRPVGRSLPSLSITCHFSSALILPTILVIASVCPLS